MRRKAFDIVAQRRRSRHSGHCRSPACGDWSLRCDELDHSVNTDVQCLNSQLPCLKS